MTVSPRIMLACGLGAMLFVGGCGGKQDAAPGNPTKPGGQGPSAAIPQAVKPAEPPPGAPPPPPPGQVPAAMTVKPAASDDVAFYRPKDKFGNVATDLEVLNSALLAYGTDGVQRPPFHDLSDLVKVGLLKKLPTAPPGKKYVFDPKTGQAKLENQ